MMWIIIEQRDIKVGPTIGENWHITKGLKAGETVVYSGLQKVASGLPIKPVPAKIKNEQDQPQ